MRLRACVVALVLLAPVVARATEADELPGIPRGPGSPAECARLLKQIQHFEDMVDRAEALHQEDWIETMQQQVGLLKQRQEERCPRDADDASAKAAFLALARLLKAAGSAALTYFTFGAY